MAQNPVIEPLKPSNLSATDSTRFRELVIEAGEVVGMTLATNIDNARVAALKRPQDSYRQKIAKLANVDLARSAWPYELGYIYIEPELQGCGLSHRLVAAALEHRDYAGVFATVRADNQRMRATLEKAGFKPAGVHYEGLQGGLIGVLINTCCHQRAS